MNLDIGTGMRVYIDDEMHEYVCKVGVSIFICSYEKKDYKLNWLSLGVYNNSKWGCDTI